MALNKNRLKNKIIATMQEIRTEEDNPEQSMERFADELAQAIIEELKAADVVGVDSRGDTHNLKIQ